MPRCVFPGGFADVFFPHLFPGFQLYLFSGVAIGILFYWFWLLVVQGASHTRNYSEGNYGLLNSYACCGAAYDNNLFPFMSKPGYLPYESMTMWG